MFKILVTITAKTSNQTPSPHAVVIEFGTVREAEIAYKNLKEKCLCHTQLEVTKLY